MQCYMKLYSSVNTVTLNYPTTARNVMFLLTLGPVNLHTIQPLNKHLYRSVSYTIKGNTKRTCSPLQQVLVTVVALSAAREVKAIVGLNLILRYFCVCGVQRRRGSNQTRSPFEGVQFTAFNRLTPNDPYMGRTAPLTSKRCILYIYSTNIGTEYFKHALYSPFFSSKCSLFHNANLFGSYIIHILYTGCAKIKKKK